MAPRRPYRPRDENGWKVPQVGTISRAIYECLRADIPTREIYSWITYRFDNPCAFNTMRVMIHHIKNPRLDIRRSRVAYSRKKQLELPL